MPDLKDLKNIDFNGVMAELLQKKELLAQVVVGAAAFLLLIVFIKGYFDQRQEYQQQIDQLKAKLDVIQTHDEGVKKIKTFLGELPKSLDEEQFSSQIADYASQAGVSILSFSPGAKLSEDLEEITTAKVSIRADNYRDFLNFIKIIESSPFALRVDNCGVAARKQYDNLYAKNLGIEAQIELSSVAIKNFVKK